MIESTERLLFEFRIYLQQDAEASDVRPGVVGGPYDARPRLATGSPQIDDRVATSAYDRADDRVFPDPSDVPLYDALLNSWHGILGGRVSRE